MAGTVTNVASCVPPSGGRLIEVVSTWVSSAGGAADGTPTLRGLLTHVGFVPDSGGTQPTDLYDVALTDEQGANVLSQGTTNIGADLSNATPTKKEVLNSVGNPTYYPVNGVCTLAVTNAGNAKGGKVIFYLLV